MADSTVNILEAELEVMLKDIERMQEEHPDKQFPDDIADRWDRTNKTIDEYKTRIELARRDERMEELKNISRSSGSIGIDRGGLQIGGSQWRERPFDMST